MKGWILETRWMSRLLGLLGLYVKKSDIVDNLTSTATNQPLSANMGKELNDKIATTYEVIGEGCRVYKTGNVVMLNIDAYNFTSDGSTNLKDRNGNAISVPVGYRPVQLVRGYDTNEGKSIRVDTDGKVYSPETFSSIAIRPTMTWITNS